MEAARVDSPSSQMILQEANREPSREQHRRAQDICGLALLVGSQMLIWER